MVILLGRLILDRTAMTDGRIQRERDAMSAAASRCEVNGRTDGRKLRATERQARLVAGKQVASASQETTSNRRSSRYDSVFALRPSPSQLPAPSTRPNISLCEHICGVDAELSTGPFCVTRSNPIHQPTGPTQPTTSGTIWTQLDPTQYH